MFTDDSDNDEPNSKKATDKKSDDEEHAGTPTPEDNAKANSPSPPPFVEPPYGSVVPTSIDPHTGLPNWAPCAS